MLQDGPFDLTKYIPSWLLLLGWVGFVGHGLYRFVRKANRAEDAEHLAAVEKAVKPYRELADNAEHLSRQRKEALEAEQSAREKAEAKATRLSIRLEEETERNDKLQAKVMLIQGRQDEVERRLDAIERGRS